MCQSVALSHGIEDRIKLRANLNQAVNQDIGSLFNQQNLAGNIEESNLLAGNQHKRQKKVDSVDRNAEELLSIFFNFCGSNPVKRRSGRI